MADEQTHIPADETPQNGTHSDGAPVPPADMPEAAAPVEGYEDRLERLGGEPAPVIKPEEFARLQKAGQVHIDARGRVRTARREDTDGGVSLRKRRAWYSTGR